METSRLTVTIRRLFMIIASWILLQPFCSPPLRAATLRDALFQSEPEVVQVIAPNGRSYRLTIHTLSDRLSPRHGVKFCWLRLPISHVDLVIKEVTRFEGTVPIFESIREEKDVVIINGGFYGYDARDQFMPLGLVVSGGKSLHPVMKWKTGGVLLQRGPNPEILPIRDYRHDPAIRQALQSKPIVVYAGRNDIYSDNGRHFNRVAVGVTAQGELVVAGLFAPDGKGGSLYEFANLLIVPRAKGGPEAHVALAMDGGPGAHIYLPSIDRHFGFPGKNFVPNTVHFRTDANP